jgi:ERF superfamily protein
MPDAKPSLHRKLAQVMYEAETIPKNGIGPREQGSYPFVRVGDAADHIRKALSEKVVTMMPTAVQVVGQSDRPTSKGGTMTTVDLIVDWTITDGESGETITLQTFGAGADTGDKYSGKAMTSAMKYAFLAGFLLSTGDDTENQDTSDRRSERSPQAGRAEAGPKGGLVGTAVKEKKATTDFLVRQSPDGPFLGFRLKDGVGSGVICEARGDLAVALALGETLVVGQRVQVWGSFVSYEPPVVTHAYRAFRIERIHAPEFTWPDVAARPDSGGATSEEPAANPPAPLTPEQEEELAAIPLFGTVGDAA